MTNQDKIQILIQNINTEIDTIKRALAKFFIDFAADPADALRWSTSVFDQAALLETLADFESQIRMVEMPTGPTLDTVKKCWTDFCIQCASYPERSPSPTVNLMYQSRSKAAARILSILKDLGL